jgi:hypothetical protein
MNLPPSASHPSPPPLQAIRARRTSPTKVILGVLIAIGWWGLSAVTWRSARIVFPAGEASPMVIGGLWPIGGVRPFPLILVE